MENNTRGSGLLSRAECNAMRGLAIIGIFMHNYCHWLGGIVRENEYQFFANNVYGLNRAIAHADSLLPVHLFSFFGHYGVPVFLFLSAYGLYCKYESRPDDKSDTGCVSFIRVHFLKLFKMMIVGFVAFTMIDAITPGSHHYAASHIITQLLMVNNFMPSPDKVIWPGPYWFFGLMLQLYIVYRLLFYRRHWGVVVALMAICWLAQVFCDPEGDTLNYIRYSCVGGMLPFGLGLLYARFGKQLTPAAHLFVCVVSLVLVYLLSQSYMTWYFVPIFIITLNISLIKTLPCSLLEWTGGISAALFVCHPITRKIFISVSHHGDVYTGLLLYIIASIALAWLFRELLKRVPIGK